MEIVIETIAKLGVTELISLIIGLVFGLIIFGGKLFVVNKQLRNVLAEEAGNTKDRRVTGLRQSRELAVDQLSLREDTLRALESELERERQRLKEIPHLIGNHKNDISQNQKQMNELQDDLARLKPLIEKRSKEHAQLADLIKRTRKSISFQEKTIRSELERDVDVRN